LSVFTKSTIIVFKLAQESDFNFGHPQGLWENDTVTTSAMSANITQQTLEPPLLQDEHEDAGSGIDVEESSGDDPLTTGKDDVTGPTTVERKTETTKTYQTTTSAYMTTSPSLQTTTTTTGDTPSTSTLTTELPDPSEPGDVTTIAKNGTKTGMWDTVSQKGAQ